MTNEQFNQSLADLAAKYKGQTVIANYFQLGRTTGNKFDRETKKLLRPDMPVEIDHVITTNTHWLDTGKLFEIDENKTSEWNKKLEAHKANLIKRDKASKIGAGKLAEAIMEIVDEGEEGTSERTINPPKFAVSGNLELIPFTEGMNVSDFLLTGTKKECKDYIAVETAK